MNRREMLKAVLVGGALSAIRPGLAVENDVGARVTPITGPDHPLAPRKTLVYGLGVTAASILGRSVDEGFIGDYWVMWAGIPNTNAEVDVTLWGTDLYPFYERNMSRLSMLTRLGDRGAVLIAPTAEAWRNRVPVEVLLLDPCEEVNDCDSWLAEKQLATMEAMGGIELIRIGRSEDDAQRFLDMRSGWNPPEDV